ncbi:phosphoglycolate phosphatase [Aquicoccus sp. SCR17]|nr:phosphoglycolate phosphatase [Carideicomes alvinocaridis]
MRVIFDLDGTLVDSAPDIRAAVNAMLEEEGRAPLDLATVTGFIGNGLPHLVALVIDEADLDPARHDAMTARVMTHYEAVSGAHSALYPGVSEALEALKAGGARLGLCTNKHEAPARKVLHQFGIDTFFDALVGGDSLAERKPHPAPLIHVAGALGEGPVLYLGDSEVDAECAGRAGLPFGLYSGGYRNRPVEELRHDFVFDDFAGLPARVRGRLMA